MTPGKVFVGRAVYNLGWLDSHVKGWDSGHLVEYVVKVSVIEIVFKSATQKHDLVY